MLEQSMRVEPNNINHLLTILYLYITCIFHGALIPQRVKMKHIHTGKL